MMSFFSNLRLLSKNIALLIDANDMSPNLTSSIIESTAPFGTPTYQRVYGDSSLMMDWVQSTPSPICFTSTSKEQNGAHVDGHVSTSYLSLTLDAMDLLHSNRYYAFALGVSDAIYIPLVQRLRTGGKLVIGFCNSRAPLALKDQFSKVFDISNLSGSSENRVDASEAQAIDPALLYNIRVETDEHTISSSRKTTLDSENAISEILHAMGCKGTRGDWVNIEELHVRFKRSPPTFYNFRYGIESLKELIEKIPTMEVREFNGMVKIRLRTSLLAKAHTSKQSERNSRFSKKTAFGKPLQLLMEAMKRYGSSEKWQALDAVEESLLQLYPNFSCHEYGFDSLCKTVMESPEMQIRLYHGQIQVRMSPDEFFLSVMDEGCRCDEGWNNFGQLVQSLRTLYPTFTIHDYAARSFTELAKTIPVLETRGLPGSTEVRTSIYWRKIPFTEKALDRPARSMKLKCPREATRRIIDVISKMNGSREWFYPKEVWKKLIELHPNFKLDHEVQGRQDFTNFAIQESELETSVCRKGTLIWRNAFFLETRVANWPGKLEIRACMVGAEERTGHLKSDKVCLFWPEDLIAKARSHVLGALTRSPFIGKWVELSRLEFYYHVQYAVRDCGVKGFIDLVEMCILAQRPNCN